MAERGSAEEPRTGNIVGYCAQRRASAEIAFSAISALANIEDLDEGTRLAYDDIIRGSLNEIAKVALEKLMQERGREYISDFTKHYHGQGLEKDREEGLEEMLITLLKARGFAVSKAVRRMMETVTMFGSSKPGLNKPCKQMLSRRSSPNSPIHNF